MLARLQYCRDQGVDGGVFCAHIVSRALMVRSLASPIERLLVTRRQRLIPAVLDHVEIEAEAALIELHCVNRTDRYFDTCTLEIARERQCDALLIAGGHQNFEGEGGFGLP